MIEVQVSGPEEGSAAPHLDEAALEHAARFVLEAEGVSAAEISITLMGDPEITALNVEYLGHEYPADVISFALEPVGGRIVGDIYIGHEQAARQAAEHGVAPEEELVRLVVHGTLHVLGHEHPEEDGREQSEMYRKQEQLLAQLLDARRGGS